jgi:ATP-dependent helicase/nuclease subunit A
VAYHKFLQEIDLKLPLDAAGLEAQAAALLNQRQITSKEAGELDFDKIAAFWACETGREIIAQDAEIQGGLDGQSSAAASIRRGIQREVPFTARITRADLEKIGLSSTVPIPDDEFVVVQGIVDLMVRRSKELWLIDFKTDLLRGRDITELAGKYRPQLDLYGCAITSIYKMPVTRKILYFLSESRIIEWK